jgi:hypothetical protein
MDARRTQDFATWPVASQTTFLDVPAKITTDAIASSSNFYYLVKTNWTIEILFYCISRAIFPAQNNRI